MKIALEVSLAAEEKKTGLGVYTDRLLTALASLAAPEDTFFLLHSGKQWNGRDYGPNFIPVSYACTSSQFLSILLNLNRTLKKCKPDLFHILCNAGSPPFCSVPTITTVHDLFFRTAPDLPFRTRLILNTLFRWTVRNSRQFISNSETTKDSLIAYGIPSEKITTVYPGAGTMRIPPTVPDENPYFLCVGAVEKRKGQVMLAEAYLDALDRKPDLPDLRFIGPDRGDGGTIRILAERNPKIRWQDYVPQDVLEQAYANAAAFFFPSFQEGFGLPLIEAMHAGIPVVCSDIPVFREIAENCAIFVKPDRTSFAAALEQFNADSFDPVPAQKRAGSFTWERAAAKLLTIYKEK